MTSPGPIPIIAALDIQPTYGAREAAALLGRSYSWLDQRVRKEQFVLPDGAREAAALLGRSYSWLDQRVRKEQFVLPDGAVVRPLRTPGGYRRFTTQMVKDIAICCRNHHWFSWEKLQTTLFDLAVASYRDTGENKIPS